MTPLSTSVDSISSFIEQQGVVSSGDALAVLRCLSLSINASLSGAVDARDVRLNEQALRLERLEQSRLVDRLNAGRRVEDYVGWPPEEAEALKLVVSELKLPAGFGPFEPLVRYQRQVTMPDGTVLNDENATTASRFKNWLTDYERSVNDLGQVVWTRVADMDGGLRLTIVFTELETLQGVPATQVDQLKVQVATTLATTIVSLATAVTEQRFTLQEWWSDVRIDERWYRFSRHNEDRRTERHLDDMRTEITQLRAGLQALGQEWPSLAQALLALQAQEGAKSGAVAGAAEMAGESAREKAEENAEEKVHPTRAKPLGDARG